MPRHWPEGGYRRGVSNATTIDLDRLEAMFSLEPDGTWTVPSDGAEASLAIPELVAVVKAARLWRGALCSPGATDEDEATEARSLLASLDALDAKLGESE